MFCFIDKIGALTPSPFTDNFGAGFSAAADSMQRPLGTHYAGGHNFNQGANNYMAANY